MTDREPWSRWITYSNIEWLYAEGIRRHGGTGSKPQEGCVDAALGSAYSAELYSMPEVDSEQVVAGLYFCAHLMFYLTKRHCYVDGNKRLAWEAATYALLSLGLTLEATTDEATGFVESIAKGEVQSAEEVLTWIADRLIPIQ